MIPFLRSRGQLYFGGVMLVVVIAAAATFLSEHYGAPVMLFALLIGMAFHFLAQDNACKPGVEFSANTMLRFGVGLLGLRLSIVDVESIGLGPILAVIAFVMATLASGALMSRLLGRGMAFGLLAGGSVAMTLNNLARRGLKGVARNCIIITCAKQLWFDGLKSTNDLEGSGRRPKATKFSKGSGLFDAHWLPNTTRGSNAWSHCSHVVYLYDQHPSPSVKAWLGMHNGWQDRYALSEAIQLIWRSRIRCGEPTTVYFASERMYDLFVEWLQLAHGEH